MKTFSFITEYSFPFVFLHIYAYIANKKLHTCMFIDGLHTQRVRFPHNNSSRSITLLWRNHCFTYVTVSARHVLTALIEQVRHGSLHVCVSSMAPSLCTYHWTLDVFRPALNEIQDLLILLYKSPFNTMYVTTEGGSMRKYLCTDLPISVLFFSQSAQFLYFKGRIELMKGNVDEVNNSWVIW